MSKVCIIGDPHFSPKTPISRKDDYPNTLLNKLHNLYKLCMENKVSHCIFLGDLINCNQMTVEYLIQLYNGLLEFKVAGIKLHTIIGNHDLPHGSREYLENSAISLLLQTVIDNNDLIIDDTLFVLENYYKPVSAVKGVDFPERPDLIYKILCGHYFYLNGFNDTEHTLTPEKCKEMEYNMYFLGHDHTPYEPLKVNGYEVHRPGSFSRGTSDTCHIGRDDIKVCIFDTATKQVEYKDIPGVLPSKDVFKETKLIEKLKESQIETTLSEDIDNLINSMTFDFSSDIYTVLDSLELKEEVKDKVTEYLTEEGLFRHE